MTAQGPTFIERDPTPVRFIEGRDEPASIGATWRALESHFDSLRGLTFLGSFAPGEGWYRACVQQTPDVDVLVPQLRTAVVPGGTYARLRVVGDPPGLYHELPAAFERLEGAIDVDHERPRIEYYRRHNEVHVLIPVR